MKNDSPVLPSRRRFLQVAATVSGGALTPALAMSQDSAMPGNAIRATLIEPPSGFAEGAVQPSFHTQSLDGTWSVASLPLEKEGEEGYKAFSQAGEHMPAQVPGEIHIDLMRAGKMPDPNNSDNARTQCRWPEEHSWWFRTEFTVPAGFLQHVRQRMIFDGIDLYGQIFINGKVAGTAMDAFVPLDFDVKDFLKEGTNELVVRVTSGLETIPADKRKTERKPDSGGPKPDPFYANRGADPWWFVRKAPYTFGWDWCDPLPNIGIWRSVRLEGHSQVVLDEMRLDTKIQGKEVWLTGEVIVNNLQAYTEIPAILELRFEPPQGKAIVQQYAVAAVSGRYSVPCQIAVPNAQLWWPHGSGEQPLYQLTGRIICADKETDRKRQTIGLRTIELDRSKLPEGSRFGFKVNGQLIYCKGGNWAPADLIQARITPEHYQKMIEAGRDAHFNMLRINAAGVYESDAFFDACDRAGIMVWQDFIFTDTLKYPDHDPAFVVACRDEAERIVRRLRHRASLALWCGNNECSEIMTMDKRDDSKPEKIGGVKFYNDILPEVCRALDPVRIYWPSSPCGGEKDPNSELSGDVHGWNFPGMDDQANIRRWKEAADASRGRFYTETYCNFGAPNMASIREYLKPEEISLTSTAWRVHTNEDAMPTTDLALRYHYGDPTRMSVEQFVLYTQIYQATQMGGALESMRFRKADPKDDCEGFLPWSYNDCWGELGWGIIDHYARPKAGYYWFKRAAAPVKVIVRSRGNELVTRVVNDTFSSYKAEVRCGWVRLDGNGQEMQSHSVAIPRNGMVEVARAALPGSSERNPNEWLYAAVMTGRDIPDDQSIWLLGPHRELSLKKPAISLSAKSGVLKVSSPVYCHGVHLEDDGNQMLADNFFELLPNVPQTIKINTPKPDGNYAVEAVMPLGWR